MARTTQLAALFASGLALAVPAGGQEPTLDVVLVRAAGYVAEFRRQLSAVVVEEAYVQDFRRAPGSSVEVYGGRGAPPITHRELKSDLLLVRPKDSPGYIEFRDVFEVDGVPVRDRQERLARLFLDASATAAQQIERIVAESSRYNIGNVIRTVNTPTLALVFLEPEQQPRMRFRRVGPARVALERIAPAGPFRTDEQLWTISFEEVQRGTVVRRFAGQGDLPARGRFWIHPSSGRVVMTELVIEDTITPVTIDVSYQSEPMAGIRPPIEMRERYLNRRDGTTIEGRATYGRFRRFQVGVEEKIR